MNMNNNIIPGLVLGILTLLIFTLTLGINISDVTAADINASDTLNVLVNISEKCIVNIAPDDLNWTTPIDPGSNGTYKKIQIENMGSINLTYVWFNNSYPSERPFGTGNVSKYDAGNFIVISNNTPGQTYYFPNRVEYNESDEIIYLRGFDGTTPPDTPYGRFRNGSREWFWQVDLNGASNYTQGRFYYSTVAHTQTETGADLQSAANQVDLTMVTSAPYAGDWGYGNINFGGVMPVCVAMYHDASKAMFYKYNMDAPGADSCSNAEFFINSTTQDAIMPGGSGYARVMPLVPYGVVYDSSNPEITGTITVIVSATA
ncbi:MAG: hypothetical protein JSV92_02625 [archaeon]|nr:MAG: hypothetical protein JSV92_02625 [archaeon]